MDPNCPSLRPIALVVAAVTIAIASGCGGDQSSAEPSAAEASSERDGVRVSLSVERAALPAGVRAWALVSVENTSPAVRRYQGGGCDFLASVTIETASAVTPDPGRDWKGIAGKFKQLVGPHAGASSAGSFIDEQFADQGQVVCTADLGVNEIKPGQRLEMRAAWNGEIFGVVAPPGPARVKASFPYLGPVARADAFDDPPQPVEATVPVEVIDEGRRLLSPGQAIDAALQDPRFAAWVGSADMGAWQGVGIEPAGDSFVVSLSLMVDGVTVAGRATVNRQSGGVAFERQPLR